MIEMRWVWHHFKDGAPPSGAVHIYDRLYQKLQYRCKYAIKGFPEWSDWQDVPHCGIPDKEDETK